MKNQPKNQVYQIITDLIITRLEQGIIPWKQPWSSYGPPANYVTKKPYRGINHFILNGLHPELPFYLTYKQAQSLGGYIKKGSKSIPVTFWDFVLLNKETEKKITFEEAKLLPTSQVVKIPFLKYFSVFHIADVEGISIDLPAQFAKKENEVIEKCEQIARNMPMPPRIIHGNQEAYYHSGKDYINMPSLKAFECSEMYYLVLFHELTHSTGHSSRLNRPEIMIKKVFGSSTYSKEELTAEMGASFLCGISGIQTHETIDNSTAYIQHWMEVLKDDKTIVIEASSKAQKAIDYIISSKEGE